MTLFRYALARALIHAGLRVMPEGRAKREILTALWNWRIRFNEAMQKNAKEPT